MDPVSELSTLIQPVSRLDQKAFTTLFREFAPRIKTSLLRPGLQNTQAEDLAQQVFLTVWRNAALFQLLAYKLLAMPVHHCPKSADRPHPAGTPNVDLQEVERLPVPLSGAILEAAGSARQVHGALVTLRPEQAQATLKSHISQTTLKMRLFLGNER